MKNTIFGFMFISLALCFNNTLYANDIDTMTSNADKILNYSQETIDSINKLLLIDVSNTEYEKDYLYMERMLSIEVDRLVWSFDMIQFFITAYISKFDVYYAIINRLQKHYNLMKRHLDMFDKMNAYIKNPDMNDIIVIQIDVIKRSMGVLDKTINLMRTLAGKRLEAK